MAVHGALVGTLFSRDVGGLGALAGLLFLRALSVTSWSS